MNDLALDSLGEDWTIRRSGDSRLTPEQLRVLALAAPLLVYNDECVDTLDCQIEIDTIKAQLENWWEIADRDSVVKTVNWLLNEGHHAEADEALAVLLSDEEVDADPELDEKLDEVRQMVAYMIRNEYCDRTTIPHTAIAWDLVRVVNLGVGPTCAVMSPRRRCGTSCRWEPRWPGRSSRRGRSLGSATRWGAAFGTTIPTTATPPMR